MIPEESLTMLAIVTLVLAIAAGNGAADPVSQNIARLQKGNTSERREAAEILARLGDRRAIQPLAQALHDDDQLVRQIAEHALWRVWHRIPVVITFGGGYASHMQDIVEAHCNTIRTACRIAAGTTLHSPKYTTP